MRENILIKHLKNLTIENKKIKDAFIMGVDGLLIAVLDKQEDHQRIAARMAGVIESSKRVDNVIPKVVSVVSKNKNIVAIPLSDKFVIVLIGTKSINIMTALKQVEKTKQNIISMIEKPMVSDSPFAIAGVYAFKKRTMEALYKNLNERWKIFYESFEESKHENNKPKEFQLTNALDDLVNVDHFNLKCGEFKKGILDFGRPNIVLENNRILLRSISEQVYGQIESLQNSYIGKPVVIGNKCKIRSSVLLSNVSIGDNCVIENCNLSDCVIGDNCSLKNIITRNSIFGDNTTAEGLIKDNIYLGDFSAIIFQEESKRGAEGKGF